MLQIETRNVTTVRMKFELCVIMPSVVVYVRGSSSLIVYKLLQLEHCQLLI